jgi:holo-[acyl-carrier protein] synthase
MQRIGVDAVSVDRIALAIRRSGPGFLTKVYTAGELAYCAGDAEKLAGRWAAKEAVIKCFDGTGICFPRRRIEVLPGPHGAPRARLLGDSRGAQIEVSITHHSRLAVATAHLEISEAGSHVRHGDRRGRQPGPDWGRVPHVHRRGADRRRAGPPACRRLDLSDPRRQVHGGDGDSGA